jgi:predicted transcriptional regulator
VAPFLSYVNRIMSLDLLDDTSRGRRTIYMTTEKGKEILRKREALGKELGIKYEP